MFLRMLRVFNLLLCARLGTAVVRGVNATSGAALFGVYDLAPLNGSLITNMRTPGGVVGTSSNVMIGGLLLVPGWGRMAMAAPKS